jgi:hypothetical protein
VTHAPVEVSDASVLWVMPLLVGALAGAPAAALAAAGDVAAQDGTPAAGALVIEPVAAATVQGATALVCLASRTAGAAASQVVMPAILIAGGVTAVLIARGVTAGVALTAASAASGSVMCGGGVVAPGAGGTSPLAGGSGTLLPLSDESHISPLLAGSHLLVTHPSSHCSIRGSITGGAATPLRL